MKQWIYTWTARMTAVVMLTGILLTSCNKEEDMVSDPGTAPAIPPSSSFVLDFSTFPSEQSNNGRLEESKWHYGYAALNFAFWQSLVGLQMAVPVLAFKASFDQEAVYIPSEQRWNWSYEVSDGTHTYEANLYAKPTDGKINWEMYISKSEAYENFLWYKGTSSLDGLGGSWTVSVEPEKNPREALFIEWTKENEEVASIRYTVIDKDSDQVDSYIKYGKTDGSDFDSFYHVYLAKDNNLMKIDYNSETKAGRVQSPGHYKDDEWRCWNSELIDVKCDQ
ncbi:MAG: hypothetical protein AAGE93_00960 [Bacteroidota bacterium]